MAATRAQRAYDHRLRDLVRATGDITLATRLGVPRSTVAGWLRGATAPVVASRGDRQLLPQDPRVAPRGAVRAGERHRRAGRCRGAGGREGVPTVVSDKGVENRSGGVDALIASGALRRVLAQTEDGVAKLRGLYVSEHNTRLPHSAFAGQTPDEMYFGTGGDVPAQLVAARKARPGSDASRRTARRPAPRATGRRRTIPPPPEEKLCVLTSLIAVSRENRAESPQESELFAEIVGPDRVHLRRWHEALS